jgi:5-methylcytosine-specific restriction endonuclease McrA
MKIVPIEKIRKQILDGTIYRTIKYKRWRRKVFKRDKFKCKWCGSKGFLRAHHIKKKYKFPRLIFIVANGITLCNKCHRKIWQREEEFETFFKGLLKKRVKVD